MTLYFVLEACAADRRVSLYDSFGHYHVARAAQAMPAVGTELRGVPAFRGSSIRDASPTGEVFDLVLEVVDCGRGSALDPRPIAGGEPPASPEAGRSTSPQQEKT